MNDPIKGILFDLGETLLEFGKVDAVEFFRLGCQRAYRYLQTLDVPDVPFASYHRRQYLSVRWHVIQSHLTRRDFNIMEMVDRVGQTFGHHLTRDELVELAWLWYEPLNELAKVEPGLTEMLAELAQEGLKLGIVSNTFLPAEVIDRQLEMVGLLEPFPVRVYSSQTGYRKPGRQIFEDALGRIGLRAGQTMFIGDSRINDIRGANRAGLVSVLKDPARRGGSWLARPRHRIRGLVQLPRLLRRINRAQSITETA